MCGVAGFFDIPASYGNDELAGIVNSMSASLTHRGPDDSGLWVDDQSGIALAHRRLSIIDLSPTGHQPMESAFGRYVIVYNGETYNFKEIRNELEGRNIKWRGHSDTEVILAAIEVWGLEAAIRRFNGMFAFALWDKKKRALYLCRDRLGIKPLYYARTRSGLLFGSELKAIRAHPDFEAEIDRRALALYLRHNCIPAPYTIYKNTWKLRPGHILKISQGDLQAGRDLPLPYCYWDAGIVAESGQKDIIEGSPDEIIDELDALLRDAVGRQMIADVPLGVFLSGGYDSSTVTALMQAQCSRPVRTFSIGLHDKTYNEARYAKAVAAHLGTDHTELYVSYDDALDVVPKLATIWDEPFADSSQIPTYLVSQLAKEHVTVVLSGDGGDELFAGYNRHVVGPDLWRKLELLPSRLRKVLGAALRAISLHNLDVIRPFLPQKMAVTDLSLRIEKLSEALRAENGLAFYKSLASHWKDPASLVPGVQEPPMLLDNMDVLPNLPGLRELMMCLDIMTYLPDDILTKVDRASMAVSLETRVPLLDHRVVEFAWRVPTEYKYRDGQGKWLLRQVLYRYVPKELVERPKQGFAVPIGEWLRGPLREWGESLLDEKRLQEEGFFNSRLIRQTWTAHLSGKRNLEYHLWDLLMFQAWREKVTSDK